MLIEHPVIAKLNCEMCQIYQIDLKTGMGTRGRDGKPLKRYVGSGLEFLAPCRNETGCPKGTPENPKTLSEANQLCYEHYLECKASGQFPDDPVVRRNAGLIREIEHEVERERSKQRDQIQEDLLKVYQEASNG